MTLFSQFPGNFIVANSTDVNNALQNITEVINQNAKAFIATKPAHQTRKTNPWMTRNILLLLRKRHYRLYKPWRGSQNPVYKQLYNKICNLVQRKIQVAKNRASNHITKRLNSLCQSNLNPWKIVNQYWQPSTDSSFPFYLMALPFSQTLIKTTCSIISLRPYLLCRVSLPPCAPKMDARIPPLYIESLDIFHVLKRLDPFKSKDLPLA